MYHYNHTHEELRNRLQYVRQLEKALCRLWKITDGVLTENQLAFVSTHNPVSIRDRLTPIGHIVEAIPEPVRKGYLNE
jgi:hypothetical protein